MTFILSLFLLNWNSTPSHATASAAKVFFFSQQSFESLTEDRELMGIRLGLQNLISQSKEYIKENNPSKSNPTVYFYELSENHISSFYEGTKIDNVPNKSGNMIVNIHDLNYKLYTTYIIIEDFYEPYFKSSYKELFPAMPGKFLIRAYAPIDNDNNYLMIQEVVSDDNDKITTIYHQEVWFREINATL